MDIDTIGAGIYLLAVLLVIYQLIKSMVKQKEL